MGTRNLTIVVSNNKTKVAQYGQWDGYPSGQGMTALSFLRRADLKQFKKQVDKLEFFNKTEIEKIDKNESWEKYPYLSRDLGAEILNVIHLGQYKTHGAKSPIKVGIQKLINQEDFVKDSLFCEWAYVIDLDKNTFEVYKGFNKSPLNKNERFYSKEPDSGGYYPVELLKSYSLDDLPDNDEFEKLGDSED